MSTTVPQYPFDPTGVAVSNLVAETQAIQSRGMFDHYYIIPRSGPFYAESVRLRLYPTGANVNNPAGGTALSEGVHYNFGYHFAHASHTIGKPVYGAISFYDRALVGQLRMEYQTIGGEWVLDQDAMIELLANVAHNPRIATWEQVVELPHQFPVVNHDFSIDDFVGMSEVEDRLAAIGDAIEQKNEGGLGDHVQDKSNPHEVTKTQVGLGLVDNYPTAAIAEAQAGILNNRFMTPLRTKQAIDAIAIAALNTHTTNTNNPHAVTKAQVGLSSVQNYAVASQAEAEAGSSNARYMTPVRTREAIVAIVQTAFLAHVANVSNPHNVTKAQVGLGNVLNIGLATDADAVSGTGDNGVITPRLLALVMSETLGEGVADHIMDDQNPHGVTKAQVGLSSVANFPVASQAEAEDATADDRYMTPLATRRTINALVGEASSGHIDDINNPHSVTAAQVGAYTIQQVDTLLAGKLGVTAVAADSSRVYGLNQVGLKAWVESLTVINSQRLENKTLAAITAEILAGKAADSELLDGMTFEEVRDSIVETVAGADGIKFNHDVPAIDYVLDGNGDAVPAPVHWLSLGRSTDLPQAYGDITLLITGGRSHDVSTQGHHTALLELSLSDSFPDAVNPENLAIVVPRARLKYLTKGDDPIEIGYVIVGQNTPTAYVEIFIKTDDQRCGWTINEFSSGKFTPNVYGAKVLVTDLVTVEPAGIVYATPVGDYSAEIAASTAHIANVSNPHGVTKAQVGLGSVSNFATASTAEAIAGTATNRFMTPLTTADKVNNAIDSLCDQLGVVIDDALINYF